MPLFTIRTIVYNMEMFLEQCIKSVIDQRYDDYEFLIADNGSTDGSVAILKKYARLYPAKIKAFYPPYEVDASGTVYAQAKGEYTLYLDSDDYLQDGCLATFGKIIQEKCPDVIMGKYNCVIENGAIGLADAKIDQDYINAVSFDDALDYLSRLPSLQPMPWRFICKTPIVSLNGKVADYALPSAFLVSTNDNYTPQRIFTSAHSLYYHPEPFYNYRRRNNSLTGQDSTPNLRNYFITFLVMVRFFKLFPVEGARLTFVLSRMKLVLRNFFYSCDKLTMNDFHHVAGLVSQMESYLDVMPQLGDEQITSIYANIKRYGPLEGLLRCCSEHEISFLSQMPPLEDRRLYVFTVGLTGRGTARLLSRYGVKIAGFIDNDAAKHGQLFDGVPCVAPSDIPKGSVVAIATLYDGLAPTLIAQLTALGIPEENCVIRKS